ncbi:MAG: TolC family protein, partial [Candidatus Obscuribacterales bacterium]|nr:TolC family protein [Candidatus Obscuribacterales bacterium]
SSKGSLSIGARQADLIFKGTNLLDRKILASVKKVQTDLLQSYYRYLYAYNKFYLTQQQVQARKQELDAAESQAEKQRATVDLAQSQQEADGSKEDMRASQSDLASVVGAQAARTVIKNVSGVSPSMESLAVADNSPAQADGSGDGGFGGFLKGLGFGGGKSKQKDDAPEAEAPQLASESKAKDKKDKEKKKGKSDNKAQIASRPADSTAPLKAEPPESTPAPSLSSGPVSFELKDVKTTPRKSVLRVTVRNTGGDNFSFDADSISVAEGNSKLADASFRAEFDSTIVQPSQEVTGTITIFGRPWNDKLTVSLSDGSKPILLHR